MEFRISEEGRLIEEQVVRFINEKVIPAERVYAEQAHKVASGDDPPTMKSLRAEAKALGLWNLFLPDPEWGPGVSNHDYSVLCEHMGRSQIASRVFNCQAPDTGNIEILAEFGTEAQKERWLKPLLEGDIRSCFSMTEPDLSGADPTGLRTQAVSNPLASAALRHHASMPGGASLPSTSSPARSSGISRGPVSQPVSSAGSPDANIARWMCSTSLPPWLNFAHQRVTRPSRQVRTVRVMTD